MIVRIVAIKHEKQPVAYRLVRWFVNSVMGYEYAHCGLQIGSDFYELTESGIGCCKMDDLASEVTLTNIAFSKRLVVTVYDIQQYHIAIWALRAAGTRSYYIDFVRYALSTLFKRPYSGRILCTGFVEVVLGLSPTNEPPEVLIASYATDEKGYEEA